ncbi:Six-hairpin glycosidase-like protein [Xylariales sp. AK1849]|nr:Six-hairpin glycosidase-like protein [Xylariales sp. AK1849]
MKHFFAFLSFLDVSSALPPNGIDYHHLPNETVFPGPWDDYIKAPANKSFITPKSIYAVEGNVTTSNSELFNRDGNLPAGTSILIGEGGHLTVEFAENIAGRVCFELESSAAEPVVMLAYSESSFFVGEQTDATNDEKWDLPLDFHVGNRTGSMCVDPEFIRGGFKYLTAYIEHIPVLTHVDGGQQAVLEENRPYSKPSIGLTRIWVNCTSFPSQPNGRAYSGYFYSSSRLLNRIWYAGAYTLQLSTIDPKEGSALIPLNQYLDHNHSPPGSWYSNFTVAHGTAVTTDGAKRDRLVWPGDMYVAIPGIAVSTYDMLAVRNALDILYERQYSDGRLPYAGPPLSYHDEFSDTYHLHTLLGTYDYVLYSGDIAWLRGKWPAYLKALRVSTSKIDSKDLMHVTSTFDWNRHGMGGHNVEATAILHTVLNRSAELASWLKRDSQGTSDASEQPDTSTWTTLSRRLESGIKALYCQRSGLYSDNLEDRHCSGPDHVDPQDGNSWALIAGMHNASSNTPLTVSQSLRSRWTKYGAPAPEFPNIMSPFSSSFELQGHCAARNHDAAVELMLLMWGYLLDGPGFTNSTLAEGFRTDGYVHYPAYPVPSRNSHAHGWAAGPTSTLMGGILGIKLLKPGGVQWEVRPVITSWLGWVRGGFAVGDGSFEVKVRRVLLQNDASAEVIKKGIVAMVRGPKGSKGRFGWGDEEEAMGFHADILGGGARAWVRWELSDNENMTEELNISQAGLGMRDDEKWHEEEIPYEDGQVIVYDHTFEEPVMEEREPGVVDFEALAKHYVEPLEWLRRDESSLGDL